MKWKNKKLMTLALAVIMLITSFGASPVSADSKASRLGSDANVTTGWYVLRPGCTSVRALTIKGTSKSNNATACLWTWLKWPQYWYIKRYSDGTYTIRNCTSGKYLEVKNGSTSSGATVQQYSYTGKLRQRWYIYKSGSRYVIQSCISKNVLSVLNAQNKNGATVFTHSRSSSSAQLWTLIRYKGSTAKATATPTPKPTATPTPKPTATPTPAVSASKIKNRTNFNTTYNGKRTLKAYLQNALVPCGRTLYIWGGGWGGLGSDTGVIGYQSSWASFFASKATSSYNYTNYRYNYGKGLDCSGFAAWVIYNTCYTKSGQRNMVYQSSTVASVYAKVGWGTLAKNSSDKTFKPGDVVSMNGHVWISLGQYSDKSVLLIHSSPKGVQISGTSGIAATKAKYYMSKYFPEWPYTARTVGSGYLSYVGKLRWKTSGSGCLLKDPDGIQDMSADQVMKLIVGS